MPCTSHRNLLGDTCTKCPDPQDVLPVNSGQVTPDFRNLLNNNFSILKCLAENCQNPEALTGQAEFYADTSYPTNEELLNDATDQDAGIGSIIDIGGKYWQVNASGSPTRIGYTLRSSDDPTENVKRLKDAISDAATEVTALNSDITDTGASIYSNTQFSSKSNLYLEGVWNINETIRVNTQINIYNGIFVRESESSATTQEAISIEAGSFTVEVDAVPAHWKVGTRVVVRDPGVATTNGIGPNSHINLGHSTGGTTTMRIDAINGNVLTIGNGSDTAFSSGVEIVQSVDFFLVQQEAGFFDCIFNGNKSNNPLEDWLASSAVAFDSDTSNRSIFERCIFYDSPCESILGASNSTITDCSWYNCNGSTVHVSQPQGVTDISKGIGVEIIRPYAVDCCLKSQSVEHAEAYVTFSIKTKFVTIRDGNFRNTTRYSGTDVGACDIIGEVSHIDEDSFILFDNMTCKNFENIWYFRPTTGTEHTHSFKITNSTFVSCGDIWTNTGNIENATVSKQHVGLDIINNRFWGGRVHTNNGLGLRIEGNNFYLQGYDGVIEDSPTGESDADAAILYLRGDHFTVRNNKFFNHIDDDGYPNLIATSGGTDIDHAIRIDAEIEGDELKITKNTIIEGNECYGLARAIRVGNNASYFPSSNYFKAIRISNNYLVMTRGNDGSTDLNGTLQLGIIGMPGCVIRDNEIIGIGVISTGILATGANDTYDDRAIYVLNNIVRCTDNPGNSGIRYGVATTLNRAVIARNNFAPSFNNYSGHATQDISGDVTLPLEPDLGVSWVFQQYPAPF